MLTCVCWRAPGAPSAENIRERAAPDGMFSRPRWGTKSCKRLLHKSWRVFHWKVSKHSLRNAACWPVLIWTRFHGSASQTDKTCGAPFRKLVCLESPQQLGANDSQPDGPAWCMCPVAPPFVLNLTFGLQLNKSIPASHVCWILKCSWEELLHSTGGCFSVSSVH